MRSGTCSPAVADDANLSRCIPNNRHAGGCAAPIGEYTMVFNRRGFFETQRFGLNAFDDASAAGVVLKFDHERTIDAQVTRVWIDRARLMFRADLRDSASGREALRLAQSDAFRGVSVGMSQVAEQFVERNLTEVTRCHLDEISLITTRKHPAFGGGATWVSVLGGTTVREATQ